MLARFPTKRLLMVGSLLALPLALFWLVSSKELERGTALVMSALSLGLAVVNVWDQLRLARKKAMAEVDFARDLIDKGQYRAAMGRLDLAQKLDPECFEARVVRGEVFRSEQSYDRARRELVEAIQMRPESFRAHFALGLTYLQEKKVLEAISAFRRTLQLKEDFREAHFILAQSYELAGERAKALEAYRAFLKAVEHDESAGRKIAEYVERSQSRILALQ